MRAKQLNIEVLSIYMILICQTQQNSHHKHIRKTCQLLEANLGLGHVPQLVQKNKIYIRRYAKSTYKEPKTEATFLQHVSPLSCSPALRLY